LSLDWQPQEHYKDPAIAEAYDRTRFHGLGGRVFDRLEKRALIRAFRDLPVGSEIVDVPCGTGRLAEALLGAGYRVTGIDISQAMLDQAKRKLVRFGLAFTCKLGDAMALPPPERPFAAALCARVLMHFPLDQQIEFLRGVARQTNGLIVFNQSYDSRYQRFRRRVKRFLKYPKPVAFPLGEAELGRLLEGVGLRELRRIRLAPLVSEAFFLIATKR
jgi:ubiquinone/menaquinone biosynthesis C-methylase UbiE